MSKGKYRVGYDELRDDRLFVMNLYPVGAHKWQLVTYRNTGSLPSIRDDTFDSLNDATAYLKHFEPLTPLDSLGRNPLQLGHLDSDEDKYLAYKSWLDDMDLFSVLEQRLHCPFWHAPRGWTERNLSKSEVHAKSISDLKDQEDENLNYESKDH